MRRFLYRLLFIALLLISQITLSVSFAIFLPNLFQADIPIEHNTQSERDLALGTALFSIITKITPSPLNSEQKNSYSNPLGALLALIQSKKPHR